MGIDIEIKIHYVLIETNIQKQVGIIISIVLGFIGFGIVRIFQMIPPICCVFVPFLSVLSFSLARFYKFSRHEL